MRFEKNGKRTMVVFSDLKKKFTLGVNGVSAEPRDNEAFQQNVLLLKKLDNVFLDIVIFVAQYDTVITDQLC